MSLMFSLTLVMPSPSRKLIIRFSNSCISTCPTGIFISFEESKSLGSSVEALGFEPSLSGYMSSLMSKVTASLFAESLVLCWRQDSKHAGLLLKCPFDKLPLSELKSRVVEEPFVLWWIYESFCSLSDWSYDSLMSYSGRTSDFVKNDGLSYI